MAPRCAKKKFMHDMLMLRQYAKQDNCNSKLLNNFNYQRNQISEHLIQTFLWGAVFYRCDLHEILTWNNSSAQFIGVFLWLETRSFIILETPGYDQKEKNDGANPIWSRDIRLMCAKNEKYTLYINIILCVPTLLHLLSCQCYCNASLMQKHLVRCSLIAIKHILTYT